MDASPIYKLRPAEVYSALETSLSGLTEGEVSARQTLYGRNLLVAETPTPLWRDILHFISNPLSLLLWGAGLVAFLVGEPALGLIIWVLILVNAGFSFWREYRAEQAMVVLRGLLPVYARVIRAGDESQIPADELVPGDLLVLAEGDNIPADGRVVEEFGLRINDSTLTGDAIAARKSADASFREGISELERPNLVFAGTSVVSGTGRAVVYSTGMSTQFGRIAHLTQTVREGPTPLQTELARLSTTLFWVAIGVGALVFILGLTDIGLDTLEAFLLAVGVLVAVVPEGLPATITLSLAMAGQRLAQRGVLIKRLSVVETLGTVSTLCTDKSGTLTQNQMTVREIWVDQKLLSVSGVGYEPRGVFYPDPRGKEFEGELQVLLMAGTSCNNARLSPPGPGHPTWTCLGDQTEAALRVMSIKGGAEDADVGTFLPRIHELPFDARRKRMSTIHRIEREASQESPIHLAEGKTLLLNHSSGQIAFVKGAPREVMQLCTHILIHDQVVPLDDNLRREILNANDDFSRRALRVLALAYRLLPARSGSYTPEEVEQHLTFIGLAAMHDPPRPDVSEAIQTCLEAGIRMVMVTGDYGLTAESVARRIGMLKTPDPMIVTGAEFDEMSDARLQAALQNEVIFARMAPEHKLRLVAALQAAGEVVAVTGDGVNDAPALRKADVGIVMGVTGTDVAKEAADVILTNDHFASIVVGIEEGRAIYANLRKFITYIFSSNVPEVLPFLLTAMLDFPLAVTVKMVLLIDLVTDMFPAIGLGMEKPEPDVMQHPPRRRDKPIIDRGLLLRSFVWLGGIEAVLCYVGFFLVFAIFGGGMPAGTIRLPFGEVVLQEGKLFPLAQTVFLAGVVMAQVGNAFATRTELNRGRSLGWLSNRFLIYGILADIIIILLLVYVPFLSRLFNLEPIPYAFWFLLIFYGPILYTLDWIRKAALRWIISIRNGN